MKVGIVGLGAISSAHISALLVSGQKIVALCDVQTEKCKRANEQYNLDAKIYGDYDQMLDSENLDAVHICTPHYLHAEMTCKALKRDINVLCEKPIAINLKQLSEVEEAVKNSSRQLGVCFQTRFNNSALYIKDYLKDKQIDCASSTLIWQRSAGYYAQSEWRGTWEQEGGGVMINQAIHGLDLLQWICGMPESVLAQVSNVSLKDQIEVEDTAFCLFKMKNGGKIVVNATNAASFSFHVHYTFRTGCTTIELSDNNISINGNLITKRGDYPVVGKEVWGTGHFDLVKNFYHCLQTGEKFSIGFEEAKKVLLMVLAVYRSNGEEVKI
ncbi:MAG: Gfo/Idh/MocA family oxidoreductase [Clostridia bacterium]|nr:Gfo/Idh/MocA family oxidoreductase [Clostridia bacterium]